MPRFAHVGLFFAALAFPACVGVGGSTAAEQGIREFLGGVFDRPDARLTVPSVAFAGDYAVAGWLQDGRGGRTLLRRSEQGWAFVACAGAELRTQGGLTESGLPPELAGRMLAALEVAEASVPAEALAKLGMFKGVLRMDAGAHP